MKSYLLLFLFLLPHLSLAHEVEESDPAEKVYRYGLLMERLANLEIQGSQERPTVPYVRMFGKKYYLNDHFYNATEEIARMYVEEIQSVCPECRVPSEERINAEVKELVARGWFGHASRALVRTVAIRYGSEFIHLGARYGTMAGALKVMGELVEDALLVVFKMPGAHFLCEVITLGISYYSRSMLTMGRTWSYAGHFGRSSVLQMARLMATSWVVKRSLKKMSLEVGPIELHPEMLERAENRSQGREWLVEEMSEERRLQSFIERLNAKVQEFDAQIQELEERLQRADEKQSRRLQSQINRLRNRVSGFTKVKRKVFEGRRLGITFWIFKRSRALTLYNGEPDLNQMFRGSRVWMLPMTASLTNQAFQFIEGRDFSRQNFREVVERRQTRASGSEVETLLLNEAREFGINPTELEKLFADIESLFDTSDTRRNRYLRLMMIEGTFGQAFPKILRGLVSQLTAELTSGEVPLKDIKKIVRLQWSFGRLNYFSDMYIDYLRQAALVRGRDKLVFEKDLAKDYLMELLRAYNDISQARQISDFADLEEYNRKLVDRLEKLESRRFWVEKRSAHSLLPVGRVLMYMIGLGRTNAFKGRHQCSRNYQ